MRPSDALIYRRLLLDACVAGRKQDAEFNDFGLSNYLPHAEVYYVAADMTAVAKHAGKTMPRQNLHLDDLPSQEGFLVWDGAATAQAKFSDALMPVRGVAWSTTHFKDRPVWEFDERNQPIIGPSSVVGPASYWRDKGDPGEECPPPTYLYSGAEVEVVALIDGTATVEFPGGYYTPAVALLWAVGQEPAGWEEGPGPQVTDDLGPTLLATWTLMQQTLARVRRQEAERAERHRSGRAGLPSMITTVHLRRFGEQGDKEQDQAEVAWSHRWLVSGHWRNQWLPSRSAHRVQWIAPHVKGPTHLPLLVKERVTAWIR
jgi:hypothetical protein